ncbi:MAG: hypothetical protein LBG72_09435 [Spirochaetaceae bacterium]|jgi:hypothetical protein|nr:hypothetical protein [Spirochaetaceae bacterium]
MKKTLLAGIMLALITSFGFSQSGQMDRKMDQRIVNVFKDLNANFKKYPYAHLKSINKTEDDRSLRNPVKRFVRQPYTSPLLDADGNPMEGEFVTLQIIKNGYRYDATIDFLPAKESNAWETKTVRGKILEITRDLPEFEILLEQPTE